MNKLFIVAHRGASAYEHENTIKAYQKAIELGADYIECDVRQTADKQFILHHNFNIGLKRIKKINYEQASASVQRKKYDVLLLSDLVKLSKGKAKLDVEIKVKGAERQIVNILRDSLEYKDFVITSFLDSVVKSIKAYDKNINCGLICGFFGKLTKIKNPIAKAIEAKADFLVPSYRFVSQKLLTEAQKNNLPLWVWTVNNPKKIQKFLQTDGIQSIITNFPDVAIKLRNENAN